jgi:hypothetical protein
VWDRAYCGRNPADRGFRPRERHREHPLDGTSSDPREPGPAIRAQASCRTSLADPGESCCSDRRRPDRHQRPRSTVSWATQTRSPIGGDR